MKYFIIALLVLAIIALGPLLTIWAINTLFPIANIPYTMDTWAAAVILAGVFKTRITKKD
jgi:hypothetical protein